MLGAFWALQTLLDMPSTNVLNSHFTKRPTAWEMMTFVSHVATQRANPYWWNFPNLPVCPSAGLIFDFVVAELVTRNPTMGIPALEDRLFLQSCWFSIIYIIYFGLGREKAREKGKEKGTFGHGKIFGDMVGRWMPNSGPGGCLGTRVMAILGPMLPPNVQMLIDELFSPALIFGFVLLN